MDGQSHERRRKQPASAVLLRPGYARLGVWLRAYRELSGISQRELSSRVGMPESYVNKVELGQRRLDRVEFLDIAACVQIPDSLSLDDIREACLV